MIIIEEGWISPGKFDSKSGKMQTQKTRGKKALPRQSKVALKKRANILKAAVTLFSRHGFKRTSVDLLAEEAKVAKPTIYAHFQDKDALFAAVCELFME